MTAGDHTRNADLSLAALCYIIVDKFVVRHNHKCFVVNQIRDQYRLIFSGKFTHEFDYCSNVLRNKITKKRVC